MNIQAERDGVDISHHYDPIFKKKEKRKKKRKRKERDREKKIKKRKRREKKSNNVAQSY
jgi:hypothetical protein